MRRLLFAFLKRTLTWSAAVSFRCGRLPRGLYCFNFHRIGDHFQCKFDRGVFSCNAETFRELLVFLRDRFRVISLDDLLNDGDAFGGRERVALLTFDDGYSDNHSVALPILNELRLPAVFFIVSSYVGGRVVPWWDRIAWSVRNATVKQICVPGCPPVPLADDIEGSIRRVLRNAKRTATIPINQLAAEIHSQSGAPAIEDAEQDSLFMNWSQLRDLLAAGMAIGSHTHTHPILAHLSPQEQLNELQISKQILESRLSTTVSSISYPVGGSSAFNSDTMKLAQQSGYLIAFSYIQRHVPLPLSEPYSIPRFHVDDCNAAPDLVRRLCFPEFSW